MHEIGKGYYYTALVGGCLVYAWWKVDMRLAIWRRRLGRPRENQIYLACGNQKTNDRDGDVNPLARENKELNTYCHVQVKRV